MRALLPSLCLSWSATAGREPIPRSACASRSIRRWRGARRTAVRRRDFFENLKTDRVPKSNREKDLILEKNWPFEGEGETVQQENGPTK